MAQMSTVGSQIGQAWSTLRTGSAANSVKEFEKILETVTDNVDAYYGLGMALREDGQEARAIEAFQKALDTATKLLETIRGQVGGTDAANSLETTEDDRYMMLSRMIRQRLKELGVEAKS